MPCLLSAVLSAGFSTEIVHNKKPAEAGFSFSGQCFYFKPFASDSGMFGLNGFTLTRSLAGSTIKSISSIGIAPSNTWFPITSAPVTHSRFNIEILTGET